MVWMEGIDVKYVNEIYDDLVCFFCDFIMGFLIDV